MFKFFKFFLLLALISNLELKAENVTQDQPKVVENKFLTEGKNDAALFFQKPQSGIMHEIVKTHNIIMIVMSVIFVLCCALLLFLVFAFYNVKTLHHEEIQNHTDLTIKVIGHQWYWTYEYTEDKIKFDSYMKKDEDLIDGDKRLLSVDNAIYVPVGKNIKILVTADDVIHSWALPAFGVKKDAVPGRINETWFRADEEGVFYGQCSELCGILHGFMPIEIRVVSDEKFAEWKKDAQSKFAI